MNLEAAINKIKGKTIYVWVPYNRIDQCAVEVDYVSAVNWLKHVYKEENDIDPILISDLNKDIVLGNVQRLLL